MLLPRKLLLIFFCAFIIRLLFLSVAVMGTNGGVGEEIPRFDGYYNIAENILAGNGFSQSTVSPFIPDSIRTPLYPLFLAGLLFIFKNYAGVIFVQIIVASAIPLLAYRIAKQLLANTRLATVVAVVLVFEPLAVNLASTVQVETFFTALLLGGLMLFLEYEKERKLRTLAYASGLLALATLARPTVQYLPFLLIAFIFFRLRGNWNRALVHSLAMVIVFYSLSAPWLIRNYLQFGNPALSVQSVSVPYGFLIPSAMALEARRGFTAVQQEFFQGIGNLKDYNDITLANSREYKKRIPAFLLAHPVGLVKSIGMTFLTFFTHDGHLDLLTRLHLDPAVRLERPVFALLFESPAKVVALAAPLLASPTLFILLGRIAWICISLCFIIGAAQYLKKPEQRAKGIFILLIIFYFALTTIAVGFSVNARFRFPVNALILSFAVYGAASIMPKRMYLSYAFPKAARAKEENEGDKRKIISAPA